MTVAARSLAFLMVAVLLGCSSSSSGPDTSLVTRVCRAVGEAACGQTEVQCRDDFGPTYARRVKMGCGKEYDAYLECTISRPLVCEGPEAVTIANCGVQNDSLRACLPSCGLDRADDGRSLLLCSGGKSGEVNAKCTADCACECTAGPKTGQRFSVASCGLTVVINLLSDHCY